MKNRYKDLLRLIKIINPRGIYSLSFCLSLIIVTSIVDILTIGLIIPYINIIISPNIYYEKFLSFSNFKNFSINNSFTFRCCLFSISRTKSFSSNATSKRPKCCRNFWNISTICRCIKINRKRTRFTK